MDLSAASGERRLRCRRRRLALCAVAVAGGSQAAVHPPSTSRTVPVTKLEAWEARNTAGPTISHGSPKRPCGTRRRTSPYQARSSMIWRTSGVVKYAGASALTWMLYGANSSASTRVSCTTAPLLAAYAPWRSMPTRPKMEAMLMILPRPLGTMSSPKALAQWLPAVDTGDVDRHVHPPGPRADLLGTGAHALPVPNVDPYGGAPAAQVGDHASRLPGAFEVDVQARDVRPEMGVPQGDGLPQARGRPRHDGVPAVEAKDLRHVLRRRVRSFLRHVLPP